MTEGLEARTVERAAAGAGAGREGFRRFLSSLRWMAGTFEVLPAGLQLRKPVGHGSDRPRRRIRPGFLVHSLLGLGLRAVACTETPGCRGGCRRPGECAYGGLLEPRPRHSGLPLSRVEHIPVPLAVDAPWIFYDPGVPFRFRVFLLGDAGALRNIVTEALIEGFVEGMGTGCGQVALVPRGWREETASPALESSGHHFHLEMVAPVRLLRAKKELSEFDLGSAVRDLSFRLAVWGHYHQGLEWPPAWRFLMDDAQAVRFRGSEVRRVSFHRYSRRQDRLIRMTGLLGTVELSGISRDLARLLRFGEICGLGKGSSIGLGRIKMTNS